MYIHQQLQVCVYIERESERLREIEVVETCSEGKRARAKETEIERERERERDREREREKERKV